MSLHRFMSEVAQSTPPPVNRGTKSSPAIHVHFRRPTSAAKPTTPKRPGHRMASGIMKKQKAPKSPATLTSEAAAAHALGTKSNPTGPKPSARSIDSYHHQPPPTKPSTTRSRPKKPKTPPSTRRTSPTARAESPLPKRPVSPLMRSSSGERKLMETGPWIPAPGKTTKGIKSSTAASQLMTSSRMMPGDDLTDLDDGTTSCEVTPGREVGGMDEAQLESLMDQVDLLKGQIEREKRKLEHEEEGIMVSEVRRGQLVDLERNEDFQVPTREEVTSPDTGRSNLTTTSTTNVTSLNTTPRAHRQLIERASDAVGRQRGGTPLLTRILFEAEMASETACKAARLLLLQIERGRPELGATSQMIDGLSYLDEVCTRLGQAVREYETEVQQRGERVANSGTIKDIEKQRDLADKSAAHMEKSNARLRREIMDKDMLIKEYQSQLTEQKDEVTHHTSLHDSLETVKAHLQKQLRQKEADCNRMTVQIRTMESHLAQARLDNDYLTGMVEQTRDKIDGDKDSLKKSAKAQRQRAEKAEHLIQKLTQELLQKDELLSKYSNDPGSEHSRINHLIREKEAIEAENEELRMRLSEYTSSKDKQTSQREYSSSHKDHVMPKHSAEVGASPAKSSHSKSDHEDDRSARERQERSNKETEFLKKENDRLKDLVARRESQTVKLERTIEEMKSEPSGQKGDIRELQDKLKASEYEVERVRKQVREREEKYREINDQFSETDKRLRMVEAENRELNKRIGAFEQEKVYQTLRQPAHPEPNLHSRTNELANQLNQLKLEVAKVRQEKDSAERRAETRLAEMRTQLDQSETTGRGMQSYVQFLKKSYANVFGDVAFGAPNMPTITADY